MLPSWRATARCSGRNAMVVGTVGAAARGSDFARTLGRMPMAATRPPNLAKNDLREQFGLTVCVVRVSGQKRKPLLGSKTKIPCACSYSGLLAARKIRALATNRAHGTVRLIFPGAFSEGETRKNPAALPCRATASCAPRAGRERSAVMTHFARRRQKVGAHVPVRITRLGSRGRGMSSGRALL